MEEYSQRKEPSTADAALERHYTVKEISEIWNLDEKLVRRIFGSEPGVVSIGSDDSRHRRAYRTLRIPESVVLRVHRRMRKAS